MPSTRCGMLLLAVIVMGIGACASPASTPATVQARPRNMPIEEPPFDVFGVVESTMGGMPYNDLRAPCYNHGSLTARIEITGTVGRRRVHGQLWLGSMMAFGVRLESNGGSDPPSFRLFTKDENGTLLLKSGNRVVHDGVAALMNAAIGVPLSAEDLHEILSCPGLNGGNSAMMRLGSTWLRARTTRDAEAIEIYLKQDGSGLHYMTAIYRHILPSYSSWRVDFLVRQDNTSRLVRVRSLDWAGRAGLDYDLRFSVSAVQINSLFNTSILVLPVPDSARPATLSELGSSLPLIGR